MATSYEAIRKMFDDNKIRYMMDPTTNALVLSSTGSTGQQYLIWFRVEVDGAWLQLRTYAYGNCPSSHANVAPLLQLLASLNYQFRSIKFCWDVNDGEIAAFADILLADVVPSKDQVFSWIGFFFQQLDRAHPRVVATIATGKDPGEPAPSPPKVEEMV
jgi:hypothetical protein